MAIDADEFGGIRRIAGLAAALLACAVAGIPGVAPASGTSELRRELPARDGTSHPSRGLQQQIFERARRAAPATSAQASADRDLNHIALLEDDGSLLEFIEPGVFQTRTEAIIDRFYVTHADDYDGLVIFSAGDFSGDVDPEGGFAFELNVVNDVDGIGLPIFNEGSVLVPGLQRLRTVINMNDLGEYDEDPSATLTQFLGGASGIAILGQEFLHTVGAFVNAENVDILGRAGAHWSFFFQSHGSQLEGNDWFDNGDGSFSTLLPATGFSQLDLYLLGLLGAAQITDPMYAIATPTPDLLDIAGNATLPLPGVTVAGTRIPVTLDNITPLHGVRVPSIETSKKEYRLAFILVIPPNHTPSTFDMEKLDEFRTQWETFFAQESNGVGAIVSELVTQPVTADFECEVFAGAPGLSVRFDNDSFGSIRSFAWDFGDGQTSTERHPLHTYAMAGNYDVRLTVSGETDSQEITQEQRVRVGRLQTWFEDDFETDKGWSADPTDNATMGRFIRSFPVGSWIRVPIGNDLVEVPVQPDQDHSPEGSQSYMTGLAGPGAAIGVADVDAGATSLVSPAIDLSQAIDPVLEFWHWYVNNAGASPGRDVFTVDISDDNGQTWVRARTYRSTYDYWRQTQIRIADHVPLTSSVRIRFRASDESFPSIIEAAVDDVHIFDVDVSTAVTVSNFSAQVAGDNVVLQWEVTRSAADRLQFIDLQRAVDIAGPYETLERLPGNATFFTDATTESGLTYWYRLVLLTEGPAIVGPTIAASGIGETTRSMLQSASEQSDGSVVLRYQLASARHVQLSIYDVRGREVVRQDLGIRRAGSHTQQWNRRDSRGLLASRGMYIVKLHTSREIMTGKLLLRR